MCNHRYRYPLAASLVLLALAACDSSSSPPAISTRQSVDGTVLTAWGAPVSGATVYLVPKDQVPRTPITAADVLSGAAEAYDEPLEDAVASTAAATFPQAITDGAGRFTIASVDGTQGYFPFVAVANAQPGGLLPGGDLSRIVRSGTALSSLAIRVSGQPTAAATYVGSSTCLACHGEYTSQKVHSHRFGIRSPGLTTALQDLQRKPGFDAGLAFWKSASASDFKTKGTSLWFWGYDSTRSFDRFQVASTDPGTAEVKVYLWRDSADGKYKVTMQNLVTPADPDRTYVVELTYGGALFKQRYGLAVPSASYKGRYTFLQYQPTGDDTYYDRTRKPWRDYRMDDFWDATAKLLESPPKSKTLEANCFACHATGYRYFTDPTTNERLCDAADDPAGDIDLDRDGTLDEVNTGCEVCHGPGSEHAAARREEFIVLPSLLPPERENQICGRCHDRPVGNDDLKNEQPLSASGTMAPPGTSRADFLAGWTSRKGPATADFWNDQIHSKSHHQQYSDFLKSEHWRNDRRLVVCSDCHDLHGQGAFDGDFHGDPATGALCAPCHAVDLDSHLQLYTSSSKLGSLTECTGCHYYKVAKTGAGRRGMLLGVPTGGSGDAAITYWENDISSHLTVVPLKTNPGVAGVVPGSAMPVPYVNRCGSCHNAILLQYLK